MRLTDRIPRVSGLPLKRAADPQQVRYFAKVSTHNTHGANTDPRDPGGDRVCLGAGIQALGLPVGNIPAQPSGGQAFLARATPTFRRTRPEISVRATCFRGKPQSRRGPHLSTAGEMRHRVACTPRRDRGTARRFASKSSPSGYTEIPRPTIARFVVSLNA